MRPAEMNPKRVWMDAADCERMTRSEFTAMRILLGAVSYTASASDDLQKRLKMIPYGQQRMRLVLGGIKALADDIVGTMTVSQCQQIRNTMNDMEIRMVPKLSTNSQNVLFEKQTAKDLIDAAQEKCHGCVEDGTSCKACRLYKILEAIVPLENYGGMSCPYSLSEWED